MFRIFPIVGIFFVGSSTCPLCVWAKCKAGINACALDGSSSTYTESIDGNQRRVIDGGGCPNNNPHVPCVGDNPDMGQVQAWSMKIPAYPKFNGNSYNTVTTFPLGKVGGIIGLTLNGAEIRSCFGGQAYGECVAWDSSAVKAEGDTFDHCGGHGEPYHYHVPPSCLLEQIGDLSDGSSPQVGWMMDGFPIYGPKGPNGVAIKMCTQDGADPAYCVDSCSGRFGTWVHDDFEYRYHFLGGIDQDMCTNPINNLSADYFPHNPLCLVGCSPIQIEYPSGAHISLSECEGSAANGYSSGYTPSALSGVIKPYDNDANFVDICESEMPTGDYTGGITLKCDALETCDNSGGNDGGNNSDAVHSLFLYNTSFFHILILTVGFL